MSTPEDRKSKYLAILEHIISGRPKSDPVRLSFTAMALIELALREKAEFGLNHVDYLKDAIPLLKEASTLDPTNATIFYYLGIAHLSILEIDDSSIYDEGNTTNFLKFCEDGIKYFMEALDDDAAPFNTTKKLNEIVLLAEKKGIYLSLSTYGDAFKDLDERNIELNKAEKLKKDAKTILGLSGSLESRSERAQTIADAIALLDEALSINPKDNEAEMGIDRAYDLLLQECNNRSGCNFSCN